jgi:hypothetical protein
MLEKVFRSSVQAGEDERSVDKVEAPTDEGRPRD